MEKKQKQKTSRFNGELPHYFNLACRVRRKHNRHDNKSELLQYKLLYCLAAAAAAVFIHRARQFTCGVPAARARLIIIIVAPDGRELDPHFVSQTR